MLGNCRLCRLVGLLIAAYVLILCITGVLGSDGSGIAGTVLCGGIVGFLTEKLDIVSYNLCCKAFSTALVCPFASLEASLDIKLGAFANEFLYGVCIATPNGY